MWILLHAFFAETFQPMNAAVTFQIGLKDSARAIRGKFTFAGARGSCWVIRTMYRHPAESSNYACLHFAKKNLKTYARGHAF